MTDFLLELRSEEIPARMQDRAREDLAALFGRELGTRGLPFLKLTTFATPRRLTLIARDLPDQTVAESNEIKGPRASAPPQALDGFLRKTGLTREQLTERDGVLYAVTEKTGRATAEVLLEAIPAIIRAFPWPKAMRWGDASASTESLRWVRPLHGIVALFGEEIVPLEIAGVTSGAATLGHRFHHPGAITIGSAADYEEKLRACHVIVDQDERRALIRDRAVALAAQAGLDLVEDEGLVTENAGLTEWPVPLLGRFDPAFLDVPPEVIQLTARVNQRYFVCRTPDGKLANAFICTANITAADDGARIVEGNRKVLAARLSDARFFYETDLRVPLEEQATKLDRIVFHEKLGTVADKVERVAKLARWLVEEGIVGGDAPAPAGAQDDGRDHDPGLLPTQEHMADMAERAARLCKADLVTGMVGEFPELQGVMGGYYAAAQGEDPAVAAAIRDHYKPVGQGDEVATAPVTVAVSLADKLDTLVSFFVAEMPPSGSKDPYALRRSAISIIELIARNSLRLNLAGPMAMVGGALSGRLIGRDTRERVDMMLAAQKVAGYVLTQENEAIERERALERVTSEEFKNAIFREVKKAENNVLAFFAERLKVQQREAGVRHDLIDAVFALGGEDDLVRLLARVHALQTFVGTEDGTDLLAGYRRAANILRKEAYVPDAASEKTLSYTPELAEAALIAALDVAEPAAAKAVIQENFEGAMAALATLRAPIDAFFETVTVNDPDATKRAARLALLARVRDAVHGVADFSRIEG